MRRFNSSIIKKYFIFLFVIVTSCNKNSELNQALDLAGGNKQELEKVLNHYRQNSSDSLKYKAAVFLIKNMPYHFYYAPINDFDAAFDSIQNYPKGVIRRDVFENILDSVYKVSNSRKTELIFDIESLKSDFIINNIELAFKAWLKILKIKEPLLMSFVITYYHIEIVMNH